MVQKSSGLTICLGYGVLMATISVTAVASSPVSPAKPVDPSHAWVGLKDADSLDGWLRWHIAEEHRLLGEMLAVKGQRTIENTLLPYDRAVMNLTMAGAQSGILFSVHPEKAIRDKAQALVQVVSAEGAASSRNQEV